MSQSLLIPHWRGLVCVTIVSQWHWALAPISARDMRIVLDPLIAEQASGSLENCHCAKLIHYHFAYHEHIWICFVWGYNPGHFYSDTNWLCALCDWSRSRPIVATVLGNKAMPCLGGGHGIDLNWSWLVPLASPPLGSEEIVNTLPCEGLTVSVMSIICY